MDLSLPECEEYARLVAEAGRLRAAVAGLTLACRDVEHHLTRWARGCDESRFVAYADSFRELARRLRAALDAAPTEGRPCA